MFKMKLEKILDYISEATTADLILTLLMIAAIITVIVSILYIAVYLKKIYKVIKQEISITNKHLAHLDHNNYKDYEKR